jgi:two-component system nitrogen regulation sensor histidine kinase NtrY
MIFKRFTFRVIISVLLIAVSGMVLVWSFTRSNLVVARFSFSVIWIYLVVDLIMYVNRTNRKLKTFLDSLKYLDQVRSHTGSGRSFEELDRLYLEIAGIIRQVEFDREADRQYFHYLVEQAGVGLLAFNENGEVEIMNQAAKKMLNTRQIRNISELRNLSDDLPDTFTSMKPGSQKLLKQTTENGVLILFLKKAVYRVNGRLISLISCQNIRNELEEEELDAWQKLIRVLTHEIMNSITPVNSLTNTVIRLFEQEGEPVSLHDLDEHSLENALEALHSIEKRNKGLIAFVQSYRSLTRIKKPVFSPVDVTALFYHIGQLVKEELAKSGIQLLATGTHAPVVLDCDEKLLEQVLINLINNAVHALQGISRPIIRLSVRSAPDQVVIEVADNGCGIPDELITNIFVPFFTTRKEGSGIGLSLSRQIMRLHGGTISARSAPGKETVFTLIFPV